LEFRRVLFRSCVVHAKSSRPGNGRESRGRHPKSGKPSQNDSGWSHARRLERQRENRRGRSRLTGIQSMNRTHPATRKSSVRFRQRSELLDFLLEVTTATSNTLDLDELMSNVAEIVKKVIPYEIFAILLYSERRQDI